MKLYLLSLRFSKEGDTNPIHEAFGAFFAASIEDAKDKVVKDLYESDDFWEYIDVELDSYPEGYRFRHVWLREQKTDICHLMKTDATEYATVWRE